MEDTKAKSNGAADKASAEKSKALAAALAQIEKQFGKGSVMRLGENEVVADIQVVSA
jgi:recombination protein RecA